MIITPRLRAALTTWFIRGAMAATRCAAQRQVCVSHISIIMMAVWATSQRSASSEHRNLATAGRLLLAPARPQAERSGDFGAIWQRFAVRFQGIRHCHPQRRRQNEKRSSVHNAF